MVIKQTEVIEISPDLWETTTKTNRTNKPIKEEEEEEGTPVSGMFCLKARQDMKVFEEKEDCFILDFDPNDSFDALKLSFSDDTDGDKEVEILHEKGQVACRDFPHPRHLCSKFPFESTPHATHCDQCYCYVCDMVAPCPRWMPSYEPHCEALENTRWKQLRELHRSVKTSVEAFQESSSSC